MHALVMHATCGRTLPQQPGCFTVALIQPNPEQCVGECDACYIGSPDDCPAAGTTCADYTTCASCTAQGGCGWCPGANKCAFGTASGAYRITKTLCVLCVVLCVCCTSSVCAVSAHTHALHTARTPTTHSPPHQGHAQVCATIAGSSMCTLCVPTQRHRAAPIRIARRVLAR